MLQSSFYIFTIEVNYMDVIQEAAKSYKYLSQHQYEFVVSNTEARFILSSHIGEFMHSIGLSHLTDIPDFTDYESGTRDAAGNKIKTVEDVREDRFAQIENGDYNLSSLRSRSTLLEAGLPFTYNISRGRRYTIEDRICS